MRARHSVSVCMLAESECDGAVKANHFTDSTTCISFDCRPVCNNTTVSRFDVITIRTTSECPSTQASNKEHKVSVGVSKRTRKSEGQGARGGERGSERGERNLLPIKSISRCE